MVQLAKKVLHGLQALAKFCFQIAAVALQMFSSAVLGAPMWEAAHQAKQPGSAQQALIVILASSFSAASLCSAQFFTLLLLCFRDAMRNIKVVVTSPRLQRLVEASKSGDLYNSDIPERPKPVFRTSAPGVGTVLASNLALIWVLLTARV